MLEQQLSKKKLAIFVISGRRRSTNDERKARKDSRKVKCNMNDVKRCHIYENLKEFVNILEFEFSLFSLGV